MEPLRPQDLTWAALLGRWVEFAKASTAIPPESEGPRWRASVAPVVNLQAVTFALAEMAQLPREQRPFARDQAAVLVRENATDLDTTWRGVPMPASLLEIMSDAREALAASLYAGSTELIWPGGADGAQVLVMPVVPIVDDAGTLAMMQPGTLVMPGEPVAWWVEHDGASIVATLAGCTATHPAVPHQVYRALDEGRIVKDILALVTAEPEAGIPLLVPLLESGTTIGRFTVDADLWEKRQRESMTSERVPVVEAG